MTESFQQDGEYNNRNFNPNQLRTNQIRAKKNSLPHDKEQLYAQNLQLKNKVKDLIDVNTKLKTQLSITEKQKVNLCNIAQQQVFHPKIAPRSNSGNHKKSGTNLLPQHQQNVQSLFNNPLHRQKQNTAFKKIMRDQNIQLQKLNNENQRLKKTMKYTRMNELLAENKELLDETLRLKGIIAEQKQNDNRNYTEYVNEIDFLRKKLTQQKDSEKRNGYELKKQLEVNNELKEKLNEIQSKKIQVEKRLNKEVKQLRGQLTDFKSKLYEQTTIKSRQCQREECIKTKKEKGDLKKKNQYYQFQIKRLKQQLHFSKKQSIQKDYQIKKNQQNLTSKSPQKTQHKRNNTVVKKQEKQKKLPTESQISDKKEESQIAKEIQQQKKKNMTQSHLTENSKSKQDKNQNQIQNVSKRQDSSVKPSVISAPTKSIPLIKQKQADSFDTQKLLESLDQEKPTNNLKQEQKNKSKEAIQPKINASQQPAKKLNQSDGQYQELDYDEFQAEPAQQVKQHKQKEEKKKEKKEKTNKKNKNKGQDEKIEGNKDEKSKTKSLKNKQKSSKKLKQPIKREQQQQQQILYNAEQQRSKQDKQQDSDKAELKLIRESLVYKFMGQNYSYDNFCNDIKSSQMKEFSITEVMNLLTAEPFLLADHQIETLIMYLFQNDQPTGQQSLSAKDFIKKMKKFIGKAKPVNEEGQNKNIQILTQIIQKDEREQGKLRKKFTELDQGDGTITKQQFVKIMGYIKVKDSLLQTAIAQIAYISDDLNHLNYDFFLRRFTEEQQ